MANFFRGRTLQSVQDDEAGLLAAALEAADACASVKEPPSETSNRHYAVEQISYPKGVSSPTLCGWPT